LKKSVKCLTEVRFKFDSDFLEVKQQLLQRATILSIDLRFFKLTLEEIPINEDCSRYTTAHKAAPSSSLSSNSMLEQVIRTQSLQNILLHQQGSLRSPSLVSGFTAQNLGLPSTIQQNPDAPQGRRVISPQIVQHTRPASVLGGKGE